jgi:hypothetical protein
MSALRMRELVFMTDAYLLQLCRHDVAGRIVTVQPGCGKVLQKPEN